MHALVSCARCHISEAVVHVQAASQGRFAEMLAQQAELTAAMTPPPARRPGDHPAALQTCPKAIF